MTRQQRPIIIITAPSGSGKSTLIKVIMEKFPQLAFSISACTRPPRAGEVDGVHYHFMDADTFRKHIKENAFIEWEMVYEGKYYGTLKSEFERIWTQNKVPVVDIDVKGALNVQQQYRDIARSIFIQAPSLSILEERLKNRGTENAESLKERIDKAAYEMSFAPEFDYIVINDNLNEAGIAISKLIADFLQKKDQ